MRLVSVSMSLRVAAAWAAVFAASAAAAAAAACAIAFCDAAGVMPTVDQTLPLAEGAEALAEVELGSPGKVVVTI